MSTTSPGAKWVFLDMWDFAADVPQPVLLEYFKALLTCCNGDGQLTPEEREWCIGYCAATGGDDRTLTEVREYSADEDIHELIRRGQHEGTAHRPIIFDSIRACSSDGGYSDEEKATIRRYASAVGVTDEEVDRFEALYEEGRQLKARRVQAVFPEGTPY